MNKEMADKLIQLMPTLKISYSLIEKYDFVVKYNDVVNEMTANKKERRIMFGLLIKMSYDTIDVMIREFLSKLSYLCIKKSCLKRSGCKKYLSISKQQKYTTQQLLQFLNDRRQNYIKEPQELKDYKQICGRMVFYLDLIEDEDKDYNRDTVLGICQLLLDMIDFLTECFSEMKINDICMIGKTNNI